MHVIYAFGDSITYGAWDMGRSGWASRFRAYLDGRNDAPTYYFYPLGIHGETTDGLVKRFENEFEARRRHDDTTYTFLFAYGANDATWLMDKQRFKASIEEYEKNLRTVIDIAQSVTANIYFLDITPVNEEFSANLVKKNKSCLNEYVDLYNDKLHDIARTCGVKVITVNEEFKAEGAANLLVSDGLHPNEAGHDLIYRQVVDTLEPLLDQLER
jgi:lysophospholipase L1-like esterase